MLTLDFEAIQAEVTGVVLFRRYPLKITLRHVMTPFHGGWALTLFLAVTHAALAQHPLDRKIRVYPSIQWKYGWQDGMRANTVGSVINRDPIPAASSALSSGYSPTQISQAYGFDRITNGGDGFNQRIAITVAYGNTNIQRDLDVFCRSYNLPLTDVEIHYPYGKPSVNNSGWASETSMDVEWAHAMAPGAKIALIVAPDDMSLDEGIIHYAADSNGAAATFVSMSWVSPEDGGSADYYSRFFTNTNAVYVGASGDDGKAVEWPAAHTNVLSVGGTSMVYDDSSKKVTSETGWRHGGGGVSRFVRMPSYQSGWYLLSGGERSVPDVSYNADPYTGFSTYFTDPVTGKSGWHVYGGTSAGVPQWAALLARRASLGNDDGTLIHSQLYTEAALNYSGSFRDILGGNNGHVARRGFDLVTGLGSPVAYAGADPLSRIAPPTLSPQRVRLNPVGNKVFGAPNFRVTATSDSGLPISFRSSDPSIATNAGSNSFAIRGAGTTTITAYQTGQYSVWSDASASIQVIIKKAAQSIKPFTSIGTKILGAPSFAITPPRVSSGKNPDIRVKSGPATITGNTITLTGAGTVILGARSAEDANYDASAEVTTRFAVVTP